ncbi:hypothetical protein ES703_113632 [subsurface metagenome]
MCPGSMISDSKRLAPSTQNMIGGINWSILPNRAWKNKRGTKAIQVVSTLATTGVKTKAVPLTADSSDDLPSARKRVIFSDTTMASSTIIPSTMITAARVTLLMAKQSVKGMPSATQMPERKSRKIKSMMSIIMNPIEPLVTTIDNLFFKSTDSSSRVKSSIPVPVRLFFRKLLICFFTAFSASSMP